MKLFAPGYYKDFRCIADKCSHSCCIGWEINIDEEAMVRYKSLEGDYAEAIRDSIGGEEDLELPYFKLTEGERCPHLDSRGLCRIIMSCGENYLCNICREHPRFYNITPKGCEVGLGLCCEEAARLILSSDDYSELSVVGESEWYDYEWETDPTEARERIYDILSDRNVPYETRLERICKEYGVSPRQHSDSEWQELLSDLEYLCESHKAQFSCYTSDAAVPKEEEEALERILAYFIYRHTGSAKNERELCAAIGFSLFCERLTASLVSRGIPITEAARIVSEELEYSEDNSDQIKIEFLFMLFDEA